MDDSLNEWLQVVHSALVLVSGPLGIACTLALEFNFPYDRNWTYLFSLVLATGLTWSGIIALLYHVRRLPVFKSTVAWVIVVMIVSAWLHCFLWALMHC